MIGLSVYQCGGQEDSMFHVEQEMQVRNITYQLNVNAQVAAREQRRVSLARLRSSQTEEERTSQSPKIQRAEERLLAVCI